MVQSAWAGPFPSFQAFLRAQSLLQKDNRWHLWWWWASLAGCQAHARLAATAASTAAAAAAGPLSAPRHMDNSAAGARGVSWSEVHPGLE